MLIISVSSQLHIRWDIFKATVSQLRVTVIQLASDRGRQCSVWMLWRSLLDPACSGRTGHAPQPETGWTALYKHTIYRVSDVVLTKHAKCKWEEQRHLGHNLFSDSVGNIVFISLLKWQRVRQVLITLILLTASFMPTTVMEKAVVNMIGRYIRWCHVWGQFMLENIEMFLLC